MKKLLIVVGAVMGVSILAAAGCESDTSSGGGPSDSDSDADSDSDSDTDSDSDMDTDTDSDTDTDTDTDTDPGPCDGECDALLHTECTCAASDPCGWSNDGTCDDECLDVVEEMFDDSDDCGPYCDLCELNTGYPCPCSGPDECPDSSWCAFFDTDDSMGVCLRPCETNDDCAVVSGCEAEGACALTDTDDNTYCGYGCTNSEDCPPYMLCSYALGSGYCYVDWVTVDFIGAFIGPGKADQTTWDMDDVVPDDVWDAFNVLGPEAALASDIISFTENLAMGAWQKPDVFGIVELNIGSGYGSQMDLADEDNNTEDSFMPLWPTPYPSYADIPYYPGVTIRASLYDEDLVLDDDIGVAVLDFYDVEAAEAASGIYHVNVAGQTNNQLLLLSIEAY